MDRSKELQEPVVTIEMVWFDNGKIYITASDGKEYSQPLEAFPILLEATREQREKYQVNKWRDALRWPDIDEDIHISSFFEDIIVNYDNEVNNLLSRFPCLDLKAFANYIGMHWTKLAKFCYGVWTPNAETMMRIKSGINALGKEMSVAV